MARYRKEFTLANSTIEYLEKQKNASRIIDEAVELHKNYKNQPEKPQIIQKPRVKIIG